MQFTNLLNLLMFHYSQLHTFQVHILSYPDVFQMFILQFKKIISVSRLPAINCK